MDIQQKRNFKQRFRKFRFFNRFSRKKLFLIKRLKLSRSVFRLLSWRIFKLASLKKNSFSYLRLRVDAIRTKKYFYKYSRYEKRFLWRKKFRLGFKKFYLEHLGRESGYSKLGYYRIISNFYKFFGLYRFLKDLVKYSRLKAVLRKYNKTFRPKPKLYIRKVNREKVDNLGSLSVLLQSLVSSGKKKLALRIFVSLITLLKFKYKLDYINVYLDSLEKIRPLIYYKTMFIGGKKYKIPVLMPITKSYKISVRWLINSAQSGDSITSLFNGINSSFKGDGSVVKYRKEYHALSFENKTYIRFLRFLKTGF